MSLDSELDKVRRKRDASMAEALARGEDPFATGIRTAFEHGIPELKVQLPRLRELVGDLDAKSFALGTVVLTFMMQGLDIFQIAKMPQFEEVRRYLEKVKDF